MGAEETPASFVSRLAANHGLSAREFCLDWDVPFQAVVDGKPQAIGKIARLGDVDADVLLAHALIREDDRRFRYHGEILVRSSLSRAHVRVCPCCLLDDIQAHPDLMPEVAVHGRTSWLIGAIKTCTKHHVALVEIGNDPAPNGLHDFVHHVSPALPRLVTLAEQAARRRPNGLESYVLARLAGERPVPFVDALELHAAIKTCEMIGAVAVHGRRANLKRLTDDDWWRAAGAGFDVAAGGAAAVGEFLTELQRTYRYRRSGREGPQALFGRLYQWLEFGAKDSAYDPVREIVGEHIRRHLPVGPGDVVFGKPVLSRHLHSIRTLSLESGLHPKRLRKVLGAAGVIASGQADLADQNVVFATEAAGDAVRRAKGALSRPAAGTYLNAPRVHMQLLVDQSFIMPCVAASHLAANDQYAPADLDDFLRRLLQDARVVRTPKSKQATIPAAAKRACCSAADVVRLILDRKLAWVGRLGGKSGYLSVLVDVEEIRGRTRGPEHGGVTQREMSKRLHTTDGVVRALMKGKHLGTFIARDPVNHCPVVLIRPEEAERFQREYVSLFALAKEGGSHFRQVLKELDGQGTEPAFKRKKIGARFYRREDLNSDLTGITDMAEGDVRHVGYADRDQSR